MWGWIGRRRELEIMESSRKHANKIIEVAENLTNFLRTYFERGKEEASKVYERIFSLEKEADDIKREILSDLSRGLFHPIDREELIRFILTLDDIAANVKFGARNFLLLPEVKPPEELQRILLNMSKELHKATIKIIEGIETLYKDPRKALEIADLVERIEEAVDDMRTEALEVAIRWCDENKVPSICIITKELIDSIENATDKCEDLADIIRSIALLSL
ncbi:MAG: DUF47 family protein [Euryarchaeota archaeon]|nr:DUF47 family protein [Euryarchaeota archaeon]MCD6158554.1 DUF47 family protein [Euryarchaeota archaeon]